MAMPTSPTFPVRTSVQIAPAPMKQRPKVPISSATHGFQAIRMGRTSSGLSLGTRAAGGIYLAELRRRGQVRRADGTGQLTSAGRTDPRSQRKTGENSGLASRKV